MLDFGILGTKRGQTNHKRELWLSIYEEEERVLLITLYDFKSLDSDIFYPIIYNIILVTPSFGYLGSSIVRTKSQIHFIVWAQCLEEKSPYA